MYFIWCQAWAKQSFLNQACRPEKRLWALNQMSVDEVMTKCQWMTKTVIDINCGFFYSLYDNLEDALIMIWVDKSLLAFQTGSAEHWTKLQQTNSYKVQIKQLKSHKSPRNQELQQHNKSFNIIWHFSSLFKAVCHSLAKDFFNILVCSNV